MFEEDSRDLVLLSGPNRARTRSPAPQYSISEAESSTTNGIQHWIKPAHGENSISGELTNCRPRRRGAVEGSGREHPRNWMPCDIYGFGPSRQKRAPTPSKSPRQHRHRHHWVDPPFQRVIVLEAWRAKTSAAAATTKQVFDLNDRWHPKIFGCEANAMQELYADMLLMEAQRQNVRNQSCPDYSTYQRR